MPFLEQPMMSVKDITIKPHRGRKIFDPKKMMELKDSIAQHGVIQPIVVTKEIINGVEKIVLVAGERRFRASLMCNKTEIPYRWYNELTTLQQKRLELEENVGRADLEWPEHNELIRQIIELEGTKGILKGDPTAMTQSKIAEQLGETQGMISRRNAFATECKERPDLMAKVKHMDMASAMKVFKQQKESENVQALHAEGKIVLSTFFGLGDTCELIKDVKDEFVDAVITDSPFGIPDLDGDRGETQIYTQQLQPTDNLSVEAMTPLMEKLIPQWFRVLKPSGHVWLFFGWDCFEMIKKELTKNGFLYEPVPVIWNKLTTTGAFKGYAPAPCYEQLLIAHKPPREKRFNESFKSILDFKPVSRTLRTHPFEKPLDLLTFLIKQSTFVGGVVLDSFAGTGSLGEAAKEIGRTAILHEINKDHYFLGQKRLAAQALRMKK